MNPAQIQEQYINFMGDHVMAQMKNMTVDKALNLYLEFISYLNSKQSEFMRARITEMNSSEKQELYNDLIINGINVHQPPFWNVPEKDVFLKIMKEHPEWCREYNCTFEKDEKKYNIENPLVIGDIYMIRLHHESSSHFSAISATTTNNKDQPSKSDMKKNHKQLYMQTPVRLGEMETTNLLLTKSGETLSKILRSYSTSKTDRDNLINQLLTSSDPFNISIKLSDGKSINRELLDRYLEVPELKLVDSSDLPGTAAASHSSSPSDHT